MRFQPGQSGNPAGRPPGSRNKKTLAAEELLGERAEAVVAGIIARAEGGDPTAMRLCMERVMPTGTNRPLPLELPPVTKPHDVTAAAGAVIEACHAGTISPRETVCMLTVVERLGRIAERVQQMKERHEAWGDGADPAEASLEDFTKETVRAAFETALREEGDPRAPQYRPVNSGAAADGADGEGLYSPVDSAGEIPPRDEAEARDAAAPEREGLYSPVDSCDEPAPGPTPAADGDEATPPPGVPGSSPGAPPSPAARGRDEASDDEVEAMAALVASQIYDRPGSSSYPPLEGEGRLAKRAGVG